MLPVHCPGFRGRTGIMEWSMQHEAARHGSIRVVFADTVLSFGISAGVTFGDIARTLDDVILLRHGHPVAIDVTLGRSPESRK